MTERRELTFEDVLRNAGVREAQGRLERLMPDPATLPPSAASSTRSSGRVGSVDGGGCGSGSCGCGTAESSNGSGTAHGSNTLLDKPLDHCLNCLTLVGRMLE